jgi:NADH:ubiquinone oxidoreductase subunit 6 (subunit J)
MGFETILFLVLGLTAIGSAAAMVYFKNTIHSALFLIINFGCVALLYLMLDAPFISMVQIAVYAGAIMVLFLFVIMLLGGEQTTDIDTGANPRRYSGSVTVLALAFVSMAGIMALLQLKLPDAPGAAPLLRVVHAAKVTEPVNITIAGAGLTEPVVIEAAEFSAVSDFMTLTAGDYTVTLTDASGTTLEQTVTLANDDVITAIAYGDAATGSLKLLTTPTDLSPTEADSARLQVVNLLADTTVLLVDLGRNESLDLTTRDVTDADGNLLDADGNIIADPNAEGAATPARETVPADNMLVENLAPEAVSAVLNETEGTKTLAFYTVAATATSVEYVPVVRLDAWAVPEGTTQLVIITPDYAATADEFGNYRPRVLDREQAALTVTALEQFGSPKDIGNQLFTAFLLPVNLVGFLLMVALIGVIVLTRPAGLAGERRSTINRRRKVSRPLVSVISQQTGRDVSEDLPRLQEPHNAE